MNHRDDDIPQSPTPPPAFGRPLEDERLDRHTPSSKPVQIVGHPPLRHP